MMWDDLFTYKDGVLYWSCNRANNKIEAGSVAGSKHHRGYWTIRVNGICCTWRHRIIWEMFNGPIPDGMEIDHINHIPGDDRIENLRMVTRQENNRNKIIPANNTSGCVGVTWNKKTHKWRAQIGIRGSDGKKKTIRVYYGDSFDDAVKARKEAERIYNFHSNHGISLPIENTFCKPEAIPSW